MIFTSIKNASRYAGLSERFSKAFDYIMTHDLASMEVGRYSIDGDNVYVMVQDMELKPWNEGVWEAHRKYADIQLVLRGKELLGVRPLEGVPVQKEYSEESDALFLNPDEPGLAIPVEDNDLIVFFPEDAHRPCIRRENEGSPVRSKRAVVKVKLG